MSHIWIAGLALRGRPRAGGFWRGARAKCSREVAAAGGATLRILRLRRLEVYLTLALRPFRGAQSFPVPAAA